MSWTEKWRKQLAMAVPFLLVQIVWWTAMVRWNSWHKFTDRIAQQRRFRKVLQNGKSIRTMHSNVRPWYMSVTMIFGSMVAGATAKGASMFSRDDLAMDVKPHVAATSFMIRRGYDAAALSFIYASARGLEVWPHCSWWCFWCYLRVRTREITLTPTRRCTVLGWELAASCTFSIESMEEGFTWSGSQTPRRVGPWAIEIYWQLNRC